jgi:hypothetical protein
MALTTCVAQQTQSEKSTEEDQYATVSEGAGLAFVGVETLPCLLRVVALCTEPVPTLMLFRRVC